MRARDSSCTRAPNQGHAAPFFASCSYRWTSARGKLVASSAEMRMRCGGRRRSWDWPSGLANKKPRGDRRASRVIRSRKSLHLFQLRPRLPGIPALLKLRLGLTGRFAFRLIPRDQRPLRTAAAEESRAAAALADNADPIKTTRPLSARYDGPDSPAARRRSDDGLRFRSSLHPKINLHRGNGIPRPRDIPPKIAFRPETVSAETETQPQEPANCGLLGRLREICRFERLRGGPERTRTACQAPSQRQTAEMTAQIAAGRH
jgi:hypothetical protein